MTQVICGVVAALVACGISENAFASSSSIETSGTAIAIALPLTTAGIAAWKEDGHGLAQLGGVTALTVGTAFLLKYVVHEERPDHSDNQSFPSDTAALAFARRNSSGHVTAGSMERRLIWPPDSSATRGLNRSNTIGGMWRPVPEYPGGTTG